MYKVFLSYRRNDVPSVVNEIASAFIARFGHDNVFYDQNTLQPGDQWSIDIQIAAEWCEVMLVIIGPNWLGETSKQFKNKLFRRNRLWDDDDYVRKEIKFAESSSVSKNNVIIPVLVGDASLPEEKDLPYPVNSLLRNQAFQLSLHDRAAGIDKLVNVVESKLQEIEKKNEQDSRDNKMLILLGILFVGLLSACVYWVAVTFIF